MTEETTLRKAAHQYWEAGMNLVPVKGKKPLVNWKEWQTKRQNEKDFSSLPWNEADGFALIGGSQTNDGYHICAIDLDVKNVPVEAIDKGRKIASDLPITAIERTPSGGLHLIYLSREKPKTISVFHNLVALELLGENKLIIMAPSRGYEHVNYQ